MTTRSRTSRVARPVVLVAAAAALALVAAEPAAAAPGPGANTFYVPSGGDGP
jgi:hypothetical protein